MPFIALLKIPGATLANLRASLITYVFTWSNSLHKFILAYVYVY